jgi:excisionase family DNA binding protein
MKEYYTPNEIAVRLALPVRTVQNHAREGSIPGSIKIGKLWRFRISVFEEWMDNLCPSNIPSGTPDRVMRFTTPTPLVRSISPEAKAKLAEMRKRVAASLRAQRGG